MTPAEKIVKWIVEVEGRPYTEEEINKAVASIEKLIPILKEALQ